MLKIILLFFTQIIFSQTNNICVKYKVYATEGSLENNEKIKNSKVPDLYIGIDNALISLEYELDATKTNSHFYLKNGISINEKANRIATIFSGRDEVYVDKKEKTFIKFKNYGGDKYFVSYTSLENWNLTNDSKEIEGYICYKGTIEKIDRIKKDEYRKHTITAWYCPSIPFSFGPKEYGNLPGIILELQDNKVTFLASRIEFNVKKINNLEINSKEKILSEEEFNTIVDSKTKELFEKLDKYNEKR